MVGGFLNFVYFTNTDFVIMIIIILSVSVVEDEMTVVRMHRFSNSFTEYLKDVQYI